MALTLVAKLGHFIRLTDIVMQKINVSAWKTYDMVIVEFSIHDKMKKIRFLEETFLLTNTSIEVVLQIPFLTLSNTNIQFGKRNFTWKAYTTADTLPTTR